MCSLVLRGARHKIYGTRDYFDGFVLSRPSSGFADETILVGVIYYIFASIVDTFLVLWRRPVASYSCTDFRAIIPLSYRFRVTASAVLEVRELPWRTITHSAVKYHRYGQVITDNCAYVITSSLTSFLPLSFSRSSCWKHRHATTHTRVPASPV